MPPSPRSLLWPTILIPKKLYFSVRENKHQRDKHHNSLMYSRLENSLQLTHVECDGDDVEAHGGVGDAAEGRRLEKQESEIYYTHTHTHGQFEFTPRQRRLCVGLTRSILATLCRRRLRLCRRIRWEEELCSVELLSLKRYQKDRVMTEWRQRRRGDGDRDVVMNNDFGFFH